MAMAMATRSKNDPETCVSLAQSHRLLCPCSHESPVYKLNKLPARYPREQADNVLGGKGFTQCLKPKPKFLFGGERRY